MTTHRRHPFVPALVAALALVACGTAPQHENGFAYSTPEALTLAPEGASGFQEKPGWSASKFMVAAANPLATDAGYQVLKAGGSAVDAAIAVQMVLNLVEPQSSGIGGGLFLVHYDGNKVQTIDGRETAPAAATPDLFMKDGKPMGFLEGVVGGRSVGVPGTLRALEQAHRLYGKLPWKALFQPAIRLADQGFTISPRLAVALREDNAKTLRQDGDALAYFYEADSTPKKAGTVLRNPALAAVLRDIAERGAAAFYEGPVARDIVAKVRNHPTNTGLLTEDDLRGYKARLRDPLCFDYKAWQICGMPPPSSGPLAIGQILGMLSSRHLEALKPVQRGFGLEPSPDAVHLISEADRLAYSDRGRFVADPDFVPLPGGNASALLDPKYLQARGALIGERSMGKAQPGVPVAPAIARADDRSPELPSTSHVSVADAYGNVISMTTTIENGFGSQIMVRGFMLNNELTDFSFVPSENGQVVANRVEGGKRPRSSMSPLLVFKRVPGQASTLAMSVGSPGGSAIINYVAKVVVGTLDWGLNVQQAISLPNFGSRNGPTELEQDRASPELVDALKARGHDVKVMVQTSGLQGIQRIEKNGQPAWFGGADPRREGIVMGD